MDEPRPQTQAEIFARAADYPYPAPLRSFLQLGERATDLPDPLDLGGRRPLLAYGANAAPTVLARKLAALPHEPLPVLRAELPGFDVVFSAHISPYGAVPSTLQLSPGTTAPVYVAFPTPEQEDLLIESEPNYELRRLSEVIVRLEDGEQLTGPDAFVSRHGCLAIDGAPVALAAIESAGRAFPSLGEVEALDHVRGLLAPEQDLERFVESSLDPGLAAARTAVLHGNAIPFDL
jgi:hypothetical protein